MGKSLQTIELAHTIKTINLNTLNIDEYYQRHGLRSSRSRTLYNERIKYIADHFDVNAVGYMTVNKRADGSEFCIDGVHRTFVLLGLGYTEWEAIYYEGLSQEQEADIYWKVNSQKALTRGNTFDARRLAQEPVALRIVELANRNGFDIVTKNAIMSYRDDCLIQSVGTVESIYTNFGPEVLDETLYILARIWVHDTHRTKSHHLGGLGVFVALYAKSNIFGIDDHLDRHEVIKHLSRITCDEMKELMEAMMGFDKYGNKKKAYAKAVVMFLNRYLDRPLRDLLAKNTHHQKWTALDKAQVRNSRLFID